MIFLLNPIPSDIWRPHFLFTGTDSQSLVGGGEVGGAVRTLIIRQSYNNRDFATFLLSELHGYNIFTSVIKFTICEQRWKGPQWLKIRRQVWRRFQLEIIDFLIHICVVCTKLIKVFRKYCPTEFDIWTHHFTQTHWFSFFIIRNRDDLS